MIGREPALVTFMHRGVCRLDVPCEQRRIEQRRRTAIVFELLFQR